VARIRIDERKMMKELIVTIIPEVIESPKHKLLKKIGLLLAKTGFRIYGVGEVRIHDENFPEPSPTDCPKQPKKPHPKPAYDDGSAYACKWPKPSHNDGKAYRKDTK
jgi:hypothetical protein